MLGVSQTFFSFSVVHTLLFQIYKIQKLIVIIIVVFTGCIISTQLIIFFKLKGSMKGLNILFILLVFCGFSFGAKKSESYDG